MANIDKLSEKQDKELVELIKEGSHPAFTELYTRYHDPLLCCCKRYLNDETGAEDVVQDIFIQIWEMRDSLNITSSFWGYIHTSARNRILKMLRQFDVHSRYAQHILINTKELTEETENSIIENDYATLVDKLIESLPPRQKEIYQLSRGKDLTYKEISELLKISTETVQEHASLTLKKIREHLKQYLDIYFQIVIIFSMFFM